MLLSSLGSDRVAGRRITLSTVTEDTVSAEYLGWLLDHRVRRFLESRFDEPDEARLREFVRRCDDDPHTLLLGIHRGDDDHHIGNIKLHWDSRHLTGDVGLMIGDTGSWRQGFGTEAIGLMTELGFAKLGLRKLVAGIYDGNRASLRAFQRCGYHVEATLKEHVLLDGEPSDVLLLRLLRRDWEAFVLNHPSRDSGGSSA